MIPQLCFLQSVMLLKQAPKPRFLPIPASSSASAQRLTYGMGIVIAVLLHVLGFMLMGNSDSAPVKDITPPQVIEVSWINDQSTRPISQPAAKPQVQPQKPQPKAAQPARPVQKNQLIHQQQQAPSASETIAPETQPQPQPQPQQSTPVSTNNTASAATNVQAQDDSEPLSLPHLNAEYLDNPPPRYPAQSKQHGEQGRVLLRVFVNAEGLVEQLTLRKSSGYERLDEAALDSVKQWRFAPAKRGQQAVSAWVVVPVSFSLQG